LKSATLEGLPQLKLYQNINKFPFLVFLDIVDTKDLTLLVIEGNPTEEALNEAWMNINDAYMGVINGNQDDPETIERNELTVSYNKILRARILIDSIVKIGPNEMLIDQLYSFGYDLPENTDENLEQILKLFTANHKSDYVDLQINTKSDNNFDDDEDTEQKREIDSSYYLETIAIIMAGLKCSIDLSTLSLGLYAALVKQYRQYCKSLLKLQPNVNGN